MRLEKNLNQEALNQEAGIAIPLTQRITPSSSTVYVHIDLFNSDRILVDSRTADNLVFKPIFSNY